MKHQLRFWCTMLLLSVFGATWAQKTYHLEQVTSVKAGSFYVFEQGGHVMNNTVSESALQTTDSYSLYGLTGNETYVWKLETASGGFNMRNASLTAANYLYNSSGNNVSLSNNKSIWIFNFQTDGTVLIQNKNNNYFLGYTSADSYAYKAYSSNTSLGTYAHAIKVYKLVETNDKPSVATINDISPKEILHYVEGTTTPTYGTFALDVTPAEGVTSNDYTISAVSDNENVLHVEVNNGNVVYGAKEGPTAIGLVNVTITITPNNTEAYSAVSETFEIIVVGDKIPIATINGLSPLNVPHDSDFHYLELDATFASGITSDDYTIRYSGWDSDVLVMYTEGSKYLYITNSSGTSPLTVTITPKNTYVYEPVSQTFTVTVGPTPYRMAFMMSENQSRMNFTDNGDGTHTLELEVTPQLINQGGGDFTFCIYTPTGGVWGVAPENSIITVLNCTNIPCVNNETSVNFGMNSPGVYTFILDTTDESAPTLTVTGFSAPMYMLNGTVVNKNDNGVYSIDITVDEETANSEGGYQFSINVRSGYSTLYYGCPKGEGNNPTITLGNCTNLELLAGNSWNYVIREAGKYTVTFNVDENGVPNSLSVKPFDSNSGRKGDVNGDGEVDVRDITTLVNIILGKQQ